MFQQPYSKHATTIARSNYEGQRGDGGGCGSDCCSSQLLPMQCVARHIGATAFTIVVQVDTHSLIELLDVHQSIVDRHSNREHTAPSVALTIVWLHTHCHSTLVSLGSVPDTHTNAHTPMRSISRAKCNGHIMSTSHTMDHRTCRCNHETAAAQTPVPQALESIAALQ
jgi:hypothetical protein